MRQKLTLIYLGVITGFLVLLILNASVWLEMRINTALVLPLFTFAGVAASFWYVKRIHPGIVIALQGSLFLFLLLKFHFEIEALTIMPAIWLREGFLLNFLEIHEANAVITSTVLFANLMLLPFKHNNLERIAIATNPERGR